MAWRIARGSGAEGRYVVFCLGGGELARGEGRAWRRMAWAGGRGVARAKAAAARMDSQTR